MLLADCLGVSILLIARRSGVSLCFMYQNKYRTDLTAAKGFPVVGVGGSTQRDGPWLVLNGCNSISLLLMFFMPCLTDKGDSVATRDTQ